jgi:hypothetical protein
MFQLSTGIISDESNRSNVEICRNLNSKLKKILPNYVTFTYIQNLNLKKFLIKQSKTNFLYFIV